MSLKLLLAALSLVLSVDLLWASGGEDIMGMRFKCDEPAWVRLCLTSLEEECSLSIAPGRGLPREPFDKVVLVKGEDARVVRGPDATIGCVKIETDGDALEYLRFFSSYSTVYMFKEKVLEIFPAPDSQCFAVCLPTDRWKDSGLQGPSIRKVEGGFEVSRTVIQPTTRIPEVKVFRLVQLVGRDGRVSTLSQQELKVADDVRWRLGFPHFM